MTTTKATKKAQSKAKYGPAASKSVETTMREMKRGELRSGGSDKKVTNPKQAVAIGLSEARRRGAKVPRHAARTASSKASRGRG
jgi:hypothetical protein